MSTLIERAGRSVSSLLANALLVVVMLTVATGGAGLTVLYLAEHVEETEGMKKLRCFVDPSYEGCHDQEAALNRLKDELAAMAGERERIEAQLAGLRAVETAVDEITLFQTHEVEGEEQDVVVGTVYTRLVEARPEPERHFCYLRLEEGTSGESRNFHFQTKDGSVEVSAAKLRKMGVASKTMEFARSVCKPLLIGEEQ